MDLMNISVACLSCGSEIPNKRARRHAIFCSEECSRAKYRSRYTKRESNGLATGTIGAIAELATAIDLMRKGFEVFRALTPNCSCDLAILREGKLIRVEVRTGHRLNTGKLIWAKNGDSHEHRKDIYAVVIHETNEIIYDPELLTTSS